MSVPHLPDPRRPEHPRPQFVREAWLNLNGEWQFEIDRSDTGLERGLPARDLTGTIVVPFCPESVLSGIEETDFLEAVWYRRTVTVPADWSGARVLLHFGAVDHDTTVWANGSEVARHRGGFTPFTADLGDIAVPDEELTIVVRARDSRHGVQARGKQATWYANSHCHYTRTTGIWQTVWLEPVPRTVALKRPRITPDLASGSFFLGLPLTANAPGHRVRATLADAQGDITTAEARADLDLCPRLVLPLPAERLRVWSLQDPHLYDLTLEVLDADGTVVDTARSYAGLRSVAVQGKRLLLNGTPVFQCLVLDQGYYPDGLMTAPSDADLVRDIELGLRAGFNGARLHQKVFEERYLYHADRLGYLVRGEFGDWGCEVGVRDDNQRPDASCVTQWLEALERDYSHPSIVGWCPLNETYQPLHDRISELDDVTRAMFLATKQADPTRPVIDASGYAHRVAETDVYDSHCYEQDPPGLARDRPYVNRGPDGRPWSVPYRGQPYFCSEFGGIWWDPEAAAAAGNEPDTLRLASWIQHNGPLISRADDRGVYGPGHHAFFKSPDGREDWMVHHAKTTSTYTCTDRTTRAQKITWNADGSSHLGRPLALGATQDLPSGDPGDDHWSDRAGNSATLTFTGTRIALLSVRDTGNGIAAISVDGGTEQRVDFYGAIRTGETLQYVSPQLPYGTHTLRIRATGERNAQSQAAFVSVDRAEVYTN